MIVQCEQCQTRFKIPDEKVTEKGVKVRCTKCQNTFRVAREPAPVPYTHLTLPPSPL
ncbi:paraquat-inducible protein A, partial [Corallococcus exiguus]|uniref:zinc-ribbon domain-containing protein n=1 Tax=Corallococcus exiguus TaxID=83462 RepID=UPI0014946284